MCTRSLETYQASATSPMASSPQTCPTASRSRITLASCTHRSMAASCACDRTPLDVPIARQEPDVTYRPVRPTFDRPTLVRRDEVALQVWGDDESGEVADAIYISNEKIHLMIFTMLPGGGFTHSGEFRTVFDPDELYYVLSGELVMSNPET